MTELHAQRIVAWLQVLVEGFENLPPVATNSNQIKGLIQGMDRIPNSILYDAIVEAGLLGRMKSLLKRKTQNG